MPENKLVIITKIILFYSIFFIGMKLFIIFRGAWLLPNLLLSLPFLILAVASGLMVKKQRYSWLFVLISAVVIILVRVYETQLAVWMQQQVESY